MGVKSKHQAMKKFIFLVTSIFSLLFASGQNRTITGKVTDEKGSPLANASVVIKGTSSGTSTSADGSFSLSVPSNASSIVASYVGLADKEISLTGANSYTISLSASGGTMNEVVVVAYGTQQRRKVTGAISKVAGSEIENVPMTSVDRMLQGKVAGLQSVSPTGQPGSSQQIRIRGIGSISSSSAPLWIIDGVPVNSGDFSGATNSSNLLAGLNPNDIESISVLKDAASASIYGSRAGNGVILVPTKKGKAGKTKIRVDGEFGSNDIAYFPNLAKPLNKDEFKQLTTEGVLHVGGTQADVDAILDQFGYNTSANYNCLDLVQRKGQQQQINVSASGGDAKTQFFLSGGYFKQISEIIGSDFKRYSANTSVKHQVSKRLTLGANLNLSTFHQEGESESANFRNPIIAALSLLPTQEAYNPAGTPNYDPAVFSQIYNPIAIRQYDRLSNQTSKLLGSAFAEFNILDNLKLTSRYGVDYSTIEEYNYFNPFFGDFSSNDPSTTGLFYTRYNRIFNWVWTNLADYNFHTWQDKLSGHVTAGYEAQKSMQLTQDATGTGLPLTTSIVYPSPVKPQTPTYAGSDYAFTSLLSKADVRFLNRYTLSGSIRRDGSSRFGSDNRYGTFWSGGGAWNIDQENFMKNVDLISLLKLRASYGVNGNAEIGNYAWRTIYSFGGTYNGLPASFPQTLAPGVLTNLIYNDNGTVGNADLTWEQNEPLDIGLEVGVLKNRITVEADFYKRKTDQLLLAEPLSLTSGFPSFSNNVGAMENKGLELTIDATPIKTKDITWTITLNGSWNKNEVTRLREGQSEIINLPYIIREGEDVQSMYPRLWGGGDAQPGDPQWYKDESKKENA